MITLEQIETAVLHTFLTRSVDYGKYQEYEVFRKVSPEAWVCSGTDRWVWSNSEIMDVVGFDERVLAWMS